MGWRKRHHFDNCYHKGRNVVRQHYSMSTHISVYLRQSVCVCLCLLNMNFYYYYYYYVVCFYFFFLSSSAPLTSTINESIFILPPVSRNSFNYKWFALSWSSLKDPSCAFFVAASGKWMMICGWFSLFWNFTSLCKTLWKI